MININFKLALEKGKNPAEELEKDNLSGYKEEISDKEMQRITNELKRLGYIKS